VSRLRPEPTSADHADQPQNGRNIIYRTSGAAKPIRGRRRSTQARKPSWRTVAVTGSITAAFAIVGVTAYPHPPEIAVITAGSPTHAAVAVADSVPLAPGAPTHSAKVETKPKVTAVVKSRQNGAATTAQRPSAPTRQDLSSSGDEYPELENEVTRLVILERRKSGCDRKSDIVNDPRLRAAALAHSRDMATNDYFSHNSKDKDGRTVTPWDRAKAAGYAHPDSENIAGGYTTAEAVVQGWISSTTGHKENILRCSSVATGVGLAYGKNHTPLWTQMFGS